MHVQTIDYISESAGRDFVDSLHETGFAVLRNHPIPQALLRNLNSDWLAFFLGIKKEHYLFDPSTDQGGRAGYFPQRISETAVGQTTKDLKEFFHVLPNGPMPPECADNIRQFREIGFELGAELLKWLQEFAPQSVTESISEPFSGMLCQHASLFRILHYPPLGGDEAADAMRAAAHEDINLLTILPVAEQAGLQVKDKAGNWIDVSSKRGELIINSGDMLQEATAGFYPSTSHRVNNPGGAIKNESRISMPLFLTPRQEVKLSERHTSGSYLEERLNLING
jgi:isopenicillin N synthase-like dioxygenase